MLGRRGLQVDMFSAQGMPHQVEPDSFYGQMGSVSRRLMSDDDFRDMYCTDKGRPSLPHRCWVRCSSSNSSMTYRTKKLFSGPSTTCVGKWAWICPLIFLVFTLPVSPSWASPENVDKALGRS